MSDDSPRRGPGRPATGHDPVRTVRSGAIWDRGRELAAELDISMSRYVEEALRRENARVERSLRRSARG
jgi:hypothetical protein